MKPQRSSRTSSYTPILERPPVSGAALWSRQGRMRAEEGDTIGALRSFRRAIESDIDCIEAWIGLSDLFDEIQDRGRAAACLDVVRMIRARDAAAMLDAFETILPVS
jgi:hypothetical protein